jgi:hypothetical protein
MTVLVVSCTKGFYYIGKSNCMDASHYPFLRRQKIDDMCNVEHLLDHLRSCTVGIIEIAHIAFGCMHDPIIFYAAPCVCLLL